MEKGIILRKNLKSNFVGKYSVQEGEIIFASDTNELGIGHNETIVWQSWELTASVLSLFYGDGLPPDSLGLDGDKYIQKKDNSGTIEIIEFRKFDGSWELTEKGVEDYVWADTNLEPKFHTKNNFPYVGKYGYNMGNGYSPVNDLDVVNKEYLDGVQGVNGVIKLDGTNQMDEGYSPNQDYDVLTQEYMLSGLVDVILPTIEPSIGGVLWNDNGVMRIS